MKQEQIVGYAETINSARMKLLTKRNTDYSEQDEDNGLSNFHDVSTIAKTLGINIKASEVSMVLGILKLVRDANKKRLGELPTTEVRGDNAVDYHNYMDLAALCELEEYRLAVNREVDNIKYDENDPRYSPQQDVVSDTGHGYQGIDSKKENNEV